MTNEPLFRLDGKTALVSGSNGGLGFVLARSLTQAGATVIINGRDADKTLKAAQSLQNEGLLARPLAFDVSDPEATMNAAETLRAGGQHIDILVNNAGINLRGPLLELPVETWKTVLQTNLDAAFFAARAFVPGMIAAGGGKVVNICSLMSDLARPTTGAYTASKGGLKMLTRAMCAEWAQHNIQVNGIAPGYFVTDMTRALAADESFNAWICGRTPARRWGLPEELAGPLVLLSSAAGSFVNGQILVVDGGLSAVI